MCECVLETKFDVIAPLHFLENMNLLTLKDIFSNIYSDICSASKIAMIRQLGRLYQRETFHQAALHSSQKYEINLREFE